MDHILKFFSALVVAMLLLLVIDLVLFIGVTLYTKNRINRNLKRMGLEERHFNYKDKL